MRYLLSILLLLFTIDAWGATYNIGPGQTYTTFTALVAGENLAAGDIVDGGNNTFYERWVPDGSGSSGNVITLQNAIIDGRQSINGNYTFDAATKAYENDTAWSNVSGSIYKKACYHIVGMWEDATELTPLVCADGTCTDEAEVEGEISAGEYCVLSGVLYYRSADGGAPSTHTLLASDASYANDTGLVYINSQDYIILNNISIRYFRVTSTIKGALRVNDADNIHLVGCNIYGNRRGIDFTSCTNFTIGDNCVVYDNIGAGMMVEGTASGTIDIQGYWKQNGNHKTYSAADTYAYNGDLNAIGVGGVGAGVMTGIIIHDADFITNGPEYDADDFQTVGGDAIEIGAAGLDVQIDIYNNFFYDNYKGGIKLDYWAGGNIYNNIFKNNGKAPDKANAFFHTLRIDLDDATFDTASKVVNNIFYMNTGWTTMYIEDADAAEAATLQLSNNIYFNNGYDESDNLAYRADIWIDQNPSHADALILTYNDFYRSGTDWDAVAFFRINNTDYTIAQYSNYSTAFSGANGTINNNLTNADPLFVNASGTTFRGFMPKNRSVYGGGTDVSLTTDGLGYSIIGTPPIGAVEFGLIRTPIGEN